MERMSRAGMDMGENDEGNGRSNFINRNSVQYTNGIEAGSRKNNYSTRKQVNSNGKHNAKDNERDHSLYFPSRDVPPLDMEENDIFSTSNINGEGHSKSNGSQSTLIRHVPLIENIVMGKENTVVDEEHREDFHRNKTWKSQCLYTFRFMKAIASAHIAAFLDRHQGTWTSKKFLRIYTAVIGAFLLMMFIYVTSNINTGRIPKESYDPIPTHNIGSPISLIREYIGRSSPFMTASSHFENDKSSPVKTLQDRDWFRKGQEGPQSIDRMSPLMEHNLADTGMPWRQSYVPLFWHIPRSGGASVEEMISSCLNLIQAKEALGHEGDQVLEVVSGINGNDGRYVNVNTMRMEGIQHAKNLGLVDSDLARVITTLYVQDVPVLFSQQHKGQLFTIIRHPVSRSISLFYYLKSSYESKDYLPAHMTLDEYARSSRLEFNWMTRVLSGRLSGSLGQEHVELAKTIVKRKLLVGLLEDMEESVKRFTRSFHWNKRIGDRETQCLDNLVSNDWPNSQKQLADYPKLHDDSYTWYLLEEKNQYDMQLYYYAKTQFKEQAVLFN